MGLTVTNTNTLSLLNILNNTSKQQSSSMEKLSTGFRLNRGADDPAGLIAMRSLNSELTSVDAALNNNQRTDSMLNVADSALNDVASLLTEIQNLAQSSANEAGLSADELAANQAQIDEAITAIDRIVGTTEFNGKRLLDGSQGINTSGVTKSEITDVQVFSRDSGSSDDSVTVNVSAAAETAVLEVASAAAGSDATLSIQGADGSAVIEVNNGDALTTIQSRVNAAKAQTGVSATVSSGTLTLTSTSYGSDEFVRVSTISGDTSGTFADGEDSGTDASVTVNGQQVAVDGLNVNYSANGLNLSFNLTESFNQSTGSSSFTVKGSGGATFQLGTDSSTRATIGIDGLYATQLGSSSTGYLSSLKSGGTNSLLNDPSNAAKIASEATRQLAKVQGRIGGFQKFQVKTAMSQMQTTKESLTSAISTIRDVDYATETAELNKQNVLLQSSISLLGLANQQSSQILSLLR